MVLVVSKLFVKYGRKNLSVVKRKVSKNINCLKKIHFRASIHFLMLSILPVIVKIIKKN